MVTRARKKNKAGKGTQTQIQEGAILDWVTNEHSLLRWPLNRQILNDSSS